VDEDTRRNVVRLGWVSLLADVSGELIAPILPLYLTGVLGLPVSAVGLVDGAAELSASLFRAVGGWWSDRAGRRKPTVLFGYGLSAACKPLLAAFSGLGGVAAVRVLDRAGKGLRGSARDALIAGSVPKESWGRAFGLHRAMDTAGAVMGPLLGLWLVSGLGMSYRTLFLLAGIPALGSVAMLGFVRDVRHVPSQAKAGERESLPGRFWAFLGMYGVFAVGNSSDSFIILKARDAGLSVTAALLGYVLFNLVNSLLAPSIGKLADRHGRRLSVALGFGVFALSYAGFARATRPGQYWGLFALYGLHAALVEGSFRAVVSEFTGADRRGVAHGVFQAAGGVLAFCASVLAGALWTRVSPAAPFWWGAACAALSGLLLSAFVRRNGSGG
jgi:MFS family permease